MEDNEVFIKGWEEERKKGKFKYILTHAIRNFVVILCGTVCLALLGVGFVSIYTGTNAFHILNSEVLKKTLFNISVALIVFTISSYLEWNGNEKKYHKLLNSK